MIAHAISVIYAPAASSMALCYETDDAGAGLSRYLITSMRLYVTLPTRVKRDYDNLRFSLTLSVEPNVSHNFTLTSRHYTTEQLLLKSFPYMP